MLLFSWFLACSNQEASVLEGYTNGESYFIQGETDPTTIPFNEYFSVQVQVFEDDTLETTLEDITVSVNATMPTHGHGMNEDPTISSTENGIFIAEGLKWHMEGEWELTIYVDNESIAFAVDCCLE
jgi:hypothetical protein